MALFARKLAFLRHEVTLHSNIMIYLPLYKLCDVNSSFKAGYDHHIPQTTSIKRLLVELYTHTPNYHGSDVLTSRQSLFDNPFA